MVVFTQKLMICKMQVLSKFYVVRLKFVRNQSEEFKLCGPGII